MSESKKVFKKTGRNVTVSRDDLMNDVIDRLMNYDSMSPSGKKKVSNPYRGPVYTKVDGGKLVQVPRQIQHLAIVKWVSMKKRADMSNAPVQDPHTRLSNKTRYDVRDPFIMNRELRNIKGKNELSDMDSDNPSTMDLVSIRKENIDSRRAVGNINVPDVRYGGGGSPGDLSRDIVDFGYLMEKEIQDMPYETRDHEKGHIMPYEGKYLRNRDMPDRSHDYLDEELSTYKRAVRSNPTTYGRYKPVVEIRAANDDEVLAEENTAETEGVEHYAPIMDDYRLEGEKEIVDYSTHDCNACRGDDDGYIRKKMYKEAPEIEDRDKYSDDEAEYDEYMDYDREYIDIDQDEPVVDVKGRTLDRTEYYDGECDPTYKCMFFLLLIAIVAYVVYKKKQGEDLY